MKATIPDDWGKVIDSSEPTAPPLCEVEIEETRLETKPEMDLATHQELIESLFEKQRVAQSQITSAMRDKRRAIEKLASTVVPEREMSNGFFSIKGALYSIERSTRVTIKSGGGVASFDAVVSSLEEHDRLIVSAALDAGARIVLPVDRWVKISDEGRALLRRMMNVTIRSGDWIIKQVDKEKKA